MKTYAVILAGGRGKRMQSDTPKQYLELLGKPLLFYAIDAFVRWGIDEIILVCGEGEQEYCRQEFIEKHGFDRITHIVVGGKERYHSVMRGLQAIEETEGVVMIHDGARAFVSQGTIERCYQDALKFGSGVAAVPSKDTIKIVNAQGFVESTPPRNDLYVVQTPQTFDLSRIKKAYAMLEKEEAKLLEDGVQITDDAMIAERFLDGKVKLSEGDYTNIKVTTPEDLMIGEMILKH